jgi:WD40 repeat protein
MLWDLAKADKSQQPSSVYQDISCAYLTQDGQHALVGTIHGPINLVDINTNKVIKRFEVDGRPAYAVTMTPDKRSVLAIISGDHSSTIYVWDTITGQIKHTWSGNFAWLKDMVVTPGGRYLISGQWNVPTVWELDQGRKVSKLSGDGMSVTDIAVTPDGKSVLMASGGIFESRPKNGVIRLFDIESGEITRTLGAHDFEVSSLVITPDGRTAASTSPGTERDKGEISFWDLENGRELATPVIRRSNVSHLCLSPDGMRLITGSILGDDAIEVWNFNNGGNIASFNGEGGFTSIAMASDQRTIVAGDISGNFHALILENIEPGPPIITAFHPPEKRGISFLRKTAPRRISFCCPNCLNWTEVDEIRLGKVHNCSTCKLTVQLNPFTASVDWHPVIKIAEVLGI